MYNVLIADDEPIICDYIEQVLATIPAIHNIYKFYNGQDAYSFLEQNTVDICLLDVSMPIKTGLDIAELVHNTSKSTAILLISAHRDFAFAQKAIRFGVRGYLTKPFSSQALQQLVLECISECKDRSTFRENRWNMLRDYIELLVSTGTMAMDFSSVMVCEGTLSLAAATCTEVCIQIPKLPVLTMTEQRSLYSRLRSIAEHNHAQQCCVCLKKGPDTFSLLFFAPGQPDLALTCEVSQILAPHNLGEYTVKTSESASFADYLQRIIFEKKMNTFWQQLSAMGILAAQDAIDAFLQTADFALTAAFARYLEKTYNLHIETAERSAILSALGSLVKQKRSSGGNHHLVTVVQEYIEANYQASWLSLEAVAGSMNVSSEHLSRTFKKITGQNFSDYLVKYRIQKAIALLMDDSISIKQISEDVGFSNTAYFRSCFKTHCGITPTQYRKLRTRKEKESL